MFVYRVKVHELTEQILSMLKLDLNQRENTLREHCPIREMSVVADATMPKGELDIYLALDDFIDGSQVRRLLGELKRLISQDMVAAKAPEPRISTELIRI
jgi:hypothetical protein